MNEIEKLLRSVLEEKLSPINENLQKLNQRIEGLDHRVEGLDQRIEGLDQRIEGLDQRVGALDQRVEALDQRVETLENVMSKQFADVKADLNAIRKQTAQNSEMQSELSEAREDVENLKLDMKMVKKLILNQ